MIKIRFLCLASLSILLVFNVFALETIHRRTRDHKRTIEQKTSRIRILSPVGNSKYKAGGTVPVKLENISSSEIRKLWVHVGQDVSTLSKEHKRSKAYTLNPSQRFIDIILGKDLMGIVRIDAIASLNDKQSNEFVSTVIEVEPFKKLIKIVAPTEKEGSNSRTLNCKTNPQRIFFHGVFEDNSTRDIYESCTGTTYTSDDTAIFKVDDDGNMVPVTEGVTDLIVRNGEIALRLPITVKFKTGPGFEGCTRDFIRSVLTK